MQNAINKVKQFQTLIGKGVGQWPPTDAASTLRFNLALEELREMCWAAAMSNRAATLDALADQLYILLGTAIEFGMADVLEEAFTRVHNANMNKFEGGPKFRADGKLLKPDGWLPPDLSDL